ncbi:MAG: helix-turn-helix domain-containing protein [Candidatus Caldarchaeales archaeon]
MEIDITTTAIIFSTMFVAQTLLYTLLLLRLKKKIDNTMKKSHISQMSQHGEDIKFNESIIKALEVLSKGSLSAREVSIALGLSREHTARLLKKMVESGLVVREGKPYRYRITPSGEAVIENPKDSSDL